MNRPFMPLWIADYRADTAHLSAAQHGAYLLLIMHYWATGGLPDDDSQLTRIACMTAAEWRKAKPIVAAFFDDGWRHGRIDEEIAKAEAKHGRRVEAGKRGGIAKAEAKQNPSNATSNALASSSESEPERKKEPALRAAEPRDIRAELFDRGRQTLERITGKTPDSSRSLIGKWLKAVNDEAIHVLGAIEEAERNRVADPVAWISRVLKPKERNDGKTTTGIMDALEQHKRAFEAEQDGSGELRESPPWLLSYGGR